MEYSIRPFIISQENILRAGCLDAKMAIDVVESTFELYSKGHILYPDKVSQIFDEETQDRTNCMPATILTEKVSGMKWVSVFPSNAGKGIQNVSASILLSSTETGFPIAFLEGTICSNLRTAAISTVAAKHLAKKKPKAVGFVGAGQQSRYHFMVMKEQFPSIKKCFVSSRTLKSEKNFIEDMEKIYENVEFYSCESSYKNTVTNSDILISAISGQEPVIKADWIQKGMLYIHVGGWEDEYNVLLKADKIVCDSWKAAKHRTQTISRAYQEGLISDKDIHCDLHDLCLGNKEGRESEDEFIYFNTVGLSFVDIMLAKKIYDICKAKNEGICIDFQTMDVFDFISRRGL